MSGADPGSGEGGGVAIGGVRRALHFKIDRRFQRFFFQFEKFQNIFSK
jgi:hypothetical protein